MIIAIDIDKTIVDCRSMVYQVASKLEKALPKMPKKPKFLSKEDICKYRNLFGRIGDPKYYDPVENCIDVINDFSKEGNTVVLLSSRPNMRTFNNVILTWLEEHKLNYNFVVVNCANKAKFCEENKVNLLIDDSVKHCLKANKVGIPTILFDPKDKYDSELRLEMTNLFLKAQKSLDEIVYEKDNYHRKINKDILFLKNKKLAGRKDFHIAKSWDEVKQIASNIFNNDKTQEKSIDESVLER